ncbi:DUF6023 family protein [Actinoplanes sp. NBRC 103695]|uniref:DUF6023 family protein n=1 Tax=Actinoplanes sp. NBRC 103695 TaxID=3032202 RepID=UPI0024A3056F|nr:DUF6023 family protein [Actinoplanes sp. NBRC 103695]GLY97017.1 hypothetical protein Acsp02_42710 [Actinoplanes sp. NBRC 103695]
MTEERIRGVTLYALAAVVLLGGGLWFVRAAPQTGEDPRLRAWQQKVERVLPDVPLQALADTVTLTGDLATERTSPVDRGSYSLVMACAGTGKVRVRVSNNRRDSGRAILCSENPVVGRLAVALADEFYIQVSGEEDHGGAVFRWRLERNLGY